MICGRVRQVSQPALVIHGSRMSCARRRRGMLAGHLPNARLRLLSTAGMRRFCPVSEISGALSDFLHGD